MAEAHAKQHPYHLVDPSPWPILGAISAFVLAVGAISYMHGASIWLIAPGIIGVLYTMLVWWRDVIKEAHEGFHTSVVQLGLRYGMILFIASEVMFFVAWFWAFFDSSLSADSAIQIAKATFTGGHWPPKGIEVFDPWHLPLLNTLILLDLGHHRHLGAPFAAPRRSQGARLGAGPDGRPRPHLHLGAGL